MDPYCEHAQRASMRMQDSTLTARGLDSQRHRTGPDYLGVTINVVVNGSLRMKTSLALSLYP
jgi:hypothetical protein